jgi:hypothetical protein
MVGSFAADYQCRLIGLLLGWDHCSRHGSDLDAVRLDCGRSRMRRGGAITLLWLSAYRGVAVEARGREVSGCVAGLARSIDVTSRFHSCTPEEAKQKRTLVITPVCDSYIASRLHRVQKKSRPEIGRRDFPQPSTLKWGRETREFPLPLFAVAAQNERQEKSC